MIGFGMIDISYSILRNLLKLRLSSNVKAHEMKKAVKLYAQLVREGKIR